MDTLWIYEMHTMLLLKLTCISLSFQPSSSQQEDPRQGAVQQTGWCLAAEAPQGGGPQSNKQS